MTEVYAVCWHSKEYKDDHEDFAIVCVYESRKQASDAMNLLRKCDQTRAYYIDTVQYVEVI